MWFLSDLKLIAIPNPYNVSLIQRIQTIIRNTPKGHQNGS